MSESVLVCKKKSISVSQAMLTANTNMASVYKPVTPAWLKALKCSICHDLFHKPRILPCGHTFCSDCLNEVRDDIIRAGRKSPLFTPVYNSSFPDLNGINNAGLTITCPDSDCQYSMKLMNLSRWTLRNKALQDLVTGYKRHEREMKEVSTQTDIGLDSALVAIPRSLIPKLGRFYENGRDHVDGRQTIEHADHSVTVGRILQKAFSMDSLNQNYVPSGMVNWKSCAAILGVNILEQLIHI